MSIVWKATVLPETRYYRTKGPQAVRYWRLVGNHLTKVMMAGDELPSNASRTELELRTLDGSMIKVELPGGSSA